MIRPELTDHQVHTIESLIKLGRSNIERALAVRTWPNQITMPSERSRLEARLRDLDDIETSLQRARDRDIEYGHSLECLTVDGHRICTYGCNPR